MKIIGIVQPTYLPWLPFFERMAAADVFVLLDDVKYSKNNYYNRNAVKGVNRRREMLSVPIRYHGNSQGLINEMVIDRDGHWQKKHWGTIETVYARAKFLPQYRSRLAELYGQSYGKLIDAVVPFIDLLRSELGINTPCFLSSELAIEGRSNQKLVNICSHFGGTHFMVKPGTDSYHPPEIFAAGGIALYQWQASGVEYKQLHGSFEPGLSALDLLLNVGSVDLGQWLKENATMSNRAHV